MPRTELTVNPGNGPHRITSCLPPAASQGEVKLAVAYDPADSLLYVAMFSVLAFAHPYLFIIKSPCTLVEKVPLLYLATIYPGSIAYDPLLKDIVAVDSFNDVAYVLHGERLIGTVGGFGGYPANNPDSIAWDPELQAMLVTNFGALGGPGGGVDLLYLNQSDGSLSHTVVLNAFDDGNQPLSILVADGLIFSAGRTIDVFNARTLTYLGTFSTPLDCYASSCTSTWDPLNNTVVVGITAGAFPPKPENDSLVFLNADSVKTGAFTYKFLHTTGILLDGVGGVTYSPADHDVYFDASSGWDLWYLTPEGRLGHVFIQNPATTSGSSLGSLSALAYDSMNHDIYVCGNFLVVVS